MLDYMSIGKDGMPYCDFSAIDRDKAAAIQELHVDVVQEYNGAKGKRRKTVPVRRVRFKLADKRAALVDIGKHLGMFTEKINHTLTISPLAQLLKEIDDGKHGKVIDHDEGGGTSPAKQIEHAPGASRE